MFRKVAAVAILGFVAIPFVLAFYCIVCCDAPKASPTDFRPAGLYSLGDERTSHHTHGCPFVLEFRYRIGMSRDEIQKNFVFGARLVASASRPEKDWRAMKSGQAGLAVYVVEFERGRGRSLVAACDVYDDGESRHVLFFDDVGVLVGAEQFPSFICLSASAVLANEATSADGAGSLQFAFVAQGRATAEFCR